MAQHGFTPTLACTVVREDGSQTSRLLVNRQRQLLVCRQRAQLQSELAQLKTRVGAGGDDRGETRRRAGA